jgi:hypothetical protein
MMKIVLVAMTSLPLLQAQAVPVSMQPQQAAVENSAYDRLKTVYCYTLLSEALQKPGLAEDRLPAFKRRMEALLPGFRKAMKDSEGTLMRAALEEEVKKAKSSDDRVESHQLSITEYFMALEACEMHADKNSH